LNSREKRLYIETNTNNIEMNPKKKTISERVLELLKNAKEPLTPKEIAEKLNLKVRDPFIGAYHWGKWNFREAERKGIIEWVEGRGWKLKNGRS